MKVDKIQQGKKEISFKKTVSTTGFGGKEDGDFVPQTTIQGTLVDSFKKSKKKNGGFQ